MGGLEIHELAAQQVVLEIGDLGGVALVVERVVPAQRVRQRFDATARFLSVGGGSLGLGRAAGHGGRASPARSIPLRVRRIQAVRLRDPHALVGNPVKGLPPCAEEPSSGSTDRGVAHDTTPRPEFRSAETHSEMAHSLHILGAKLGGVQSLAGSAPTGEDLRLELDLAQKRIAELESELSRQARVRTDLVHLVSHELRTPITVISGFGRLLQGDANGTLNDQQRHFVDECLKACRRLDRFVGDLMEAGTVGGTPLAIECVDGDLHQTIQAQLESLAPLLDERGMRIELRLAPMLPRFGFDPRRIEQVITNLMTNAIRYGRPKGGVRIVTAIQSTTADRARVVTVSVEDDGCGIPENDRERLFAPYVRGEGQTKGGGLGIGLAICRRIIESHGGRIFVDSGELGGARFIFSLPIAPVERGED